MIAGFFPGQGSQSVGMGREFYDEFTVFRQTIEEASDTLGINLKTLLFEGPDSDLTLTENAQPAILAVSTGCFRVAESVIGAKTSVHLGHSLGEYSAFPFADAVAWVRTRGLAMQKAVPVGLGTMAAVIGAEDADIEVWCREATDAARALRASGAQEVQGELKCTVECANYNAPGQVVVSGSVDAVEQFEKSVSSKGIRGVMVKRLSVSAPFHSSLMGPAQSDGHPHFRARSRVPFARRTGRPFGPVESERFPPARFRCLPCDRIRSRKGPPGSCQANRQTKEPAF